jgi:hypothetical protein
VKPHLHNNMKTVSLQNSSKPCSLTNRGWAACLSPFPEHVAGGRRCQEDIKNFWMGHKPRTMSEVYSHLFEEVEHRLAESAQVGVGFDIPAYISQTAPKDRCDQTFRPICK